MAKKNEKKRSENKRRLLLLILLLAVTVSTLAVGSYAWFTSNKKVNVENLDVQVRAVNGLEISADAVTWGTNINKGNLISSAWLTHTNQLPTYLSHASSSGKIDTSTHFLTMFDGLVAPQCADGSNDCANPTYTLYASRADEEKCYDHNTDGDANLSTPCTGQHFMAFDIFLKLDGSPTNLLLTENATVNPIKEDADLGIKNTTRVAFVVQGNISTSDYNNGIINDETGAVEKTGVEAARELLGATDDTVTIWEPNYNAHTEFGVQAAKKYYGFNDTQISTGTDNDALTYEGVIAETKDGAGNPVYVPLTTTNSTTFPNYFGVVTPDIYTHSLSGKRSTVDTGITLQSGVTKIRVYFWVEGQDVDAENNATGSDMKLNLEFSIA